MKEGFIIAVATNKGGVGKTTITCNLGHALAKLGKRVLIVDTDNQCNTTTTLMTRNFSIRDSLYELLNPDDNVKVDSCVYATPYANLSCLPNVPETSGLEPSMIEDKTGGLLCRLREKLRPYAIGKFDYTFIDTPPNLGSFVLSALYTADFVIVPVSARSTFSLEGLVKAINLIERIKNGKNPDLKFLRLLINEVDRRTSSSKAVIEHLKHNFPRSMMFRTIIPINATFHQAEALNKTIIVHNFSSIGSKAFRNLATEVLDIFRGI